MEFDTKEVIIMAKRNGHPTNLEFNQDAFEYAKNLIVTGKVNCEERNWSINQPTPASEDIYLTDHTLAEYSRWFLATKADVPDNEKEHYEFPIGNFDEIYRSGIVAAKQRAAQFKHRDIEEAASKLLDLIDSQICKA